MSVRRGDIYYADLSPVVGSEQGGLRPVLIIQKHISHTRNFLKNFDRNQFVGENHLQPYLVPWMLS